MPHNFSADDIEPQPQTASGRSGQGRGGRRGPHTAAGVLDMPDPPRRSRMGTLMDRLREATVGKLRKKK